MGKEIMIRDLTFSYGGNGNQLEHISLDIAAGEVIVMTGPSGSGKSSLTRVINGLIPYFYEGDLSGEVFVDGKPLKEIPSWERGKIAGNVFQDPRSQFFANEVAGEIAFGCENYGYSHEDIQSHVHRAAADIKIQDILDHSLHILNKIMYISESFTQIDGSVERMDEILRIPVLPEKSTAATIENYGIAFQDVSFSYEADSQVKALSHVSFFADQGKVTAIVGPSGGGKSTIASLISRFYDVTDGSIQIGGVDIRDIPLDALMDKVSFVFQDTFLFKQSILDNIRMGNPNATEEQVIAAAKAARCHEFIEQLPNGYQTVIGSTGVHLSGGERQRIAIARAIVKDAPIIVLDEATAFSDPENEYLIQKAFEKLIQNKTVVMIAHRLSTIRNADQILVMEKGCLIESGTHDELLKKDGKYAQMWSSYTESINWKIGTGKAV